MIQLEHARSIHAAFSVLPFIQTLDVYYPNVSHWYVNQVAPGLLLGNDKLVIAKDRGHIAGIALGKQTDNETKLRCVRVHPDYQQSGLGIRLIDTMLTTLEVDKPACTVAEELFHEYSRLFVRRYGFELSDVAKGRYRPRKLEYAFNGA